MDKKIAEILQVNGRASSAEIAEAIGVSVSTANERVRRLAKDGVVTEWRAVLDPDKVGAPLCAFVLLDLAYEGEEEACDALVVCPEVQELHHISGRRSYLMKLRLSDVAALQTFLHDKVKPLNAVMKTETIISLQPLKETSVLKTSDAAFGRS